MDDITLPGLKRRQLPRPLPPYQNETILSYLVRLQWANGWAYREFWPDLDPRGPELPTALTELTGRSRRTLALALPELRQQSYRLQQNPQLTGGAETAYSRLACQHCTLSRGAGDNVMVWAGHEDVVCHRHQRWLNRSEQISISSCRTILAANRRHRNLISRFGRKDTRAAHSTATDICGKWFVRGHRFPTVSDRLKRLLPHRGYFSMADPYAPAALYPNVVALTAILASPFWRALAGSEQITDRDRFFERINTEVAEGNRPTGPHDPLRIWRNLTDRHVD